MTLTLSVGGRVYEGWTSIEVTRSLVNAASSFSLGVTERKEPSALSWVIQPGAPCKVSFDGEQVINGYVDVYAPSYDAGSHSVRVTGRSRTGDAVDCSAIVPGGQFRNYDLGQIAKALCSTIGVGVVIETDIGRPFPDVQIQQGETIFEIIERLCRLRAILVCDDANGNLVLTRAGQRRAQDTLVEGGQRGNILRANASISIAERYSDYIIKGQQTPTDDVFGTAATEVIGTERDPAVWRYRPKLIVAEGQTDTATARARARWEKLTRAANGTSANITVQDWRQTNGSLWQINQLVYIDSPSLALRTDLLIGSVTYRLDDNGTTTELNLAPPDAFTPEPTSEKSKSNAGGYYDILQEGEAGPSYEYDEEE